jgi:hypothetical protein
LRTNKVNQFDISGTRFSLTKADFRFLLRMLENVEKRFFGIFPTSFWAGQNFGHIFASLRDLFAPYSTSQNVERSYSQRPHS